MSTSAPSSVAQPIFSVYHDDPDFQELLEEFVAAAHERQGLLRQLYETGEVASIRMQAHQLKGSGGGYGFDELSHLAAELEQACKQTTPNLDEIGPLLDEVIDFLARVEV